MARIAEKINSILKLDELLKETVETIVDTFEYFYAAIMLMDEDSEELVFYSGAGGFAGKTPPGFRQNLKEGMIGWAAHSKKTILANDVSKEPRYIPAHLSETRSELDVPIIYRDQVIGVLDIQSKELNVFNDEDVRTLETLARHIAVAIENARLYEKAQHEIKQRIHAEDNIEQQTEAMETSMDGMAILDKKEKYVYLNQAHAKAYGYDKVEDLLGKTWRVLYNKKEIARFERQIFPMMRKEGHWCGEAVGKRRDGSCFDQEVSLSSLKDGGLVCVVRDITDRKKVEEGLYESEERLQTTLDSMGDAIHVVNKDLKIILHNKRSTEWYKKLGIPEDIIGKNLFDVFPFLPNKVRSEYRQVFKSGEPLVTEEQTLLDGKKIYTETRKIPFFEHKKVNGVITVVRDITDSKQVIEELIVSEERFRSLFENATIGIYRTTPDGKIVMANPALIRLLGYTSYVELANRNLEKEGFEPTYSRKSFKKMIEEKGEIRGLEAAWKRKDGTTIYIRESAKVFRDENGQLLYYEGTVEDITERKLAEQALQESESKLVAMTNSVSEAIVLMDSDGKVAFWNGAAEKLFGYTHEEAIGKKTIELFAIEKDTSSTYENGLDIFTKSGSESIVGKTLEFQAVKKDGTLFPMEVSVSTLELRDEWYATGIIRDITERKQIEDALRESEERYRGVVEDQTELICRFKSNGTLTFVNKAYCDYFGKNRDDLIGSHFIPLIPSEDQRTVEKNISTLSIEKPLLIHEHRVLKKDNTLGWLRWTNRGFFNQRNEIIEIQAVGSDITIRKRAEERLKDLLEEKEVLLKEVYHRVKNNFQVVTSLLNLQARNIKDTATRQIFMESRDRVRTMAMVHERLYESKDLSKLQFAEYIKTLTKNLIRSYGPGKKKVTINSEIEDIPMSIDQAIPCGLVLNELISNALKYAFPEDWKGNAELSIIFKKNSSNQIEMMVRDNGVGLPADFIFEQTESLGLHLVQILVEDQLHGTIKLVKRGGTKYRILFKKS